VEEVQPPVDLFKAIFDADSEDEEEEVPYHADKRIRL
jgi:hypothetical protein